MTAKEYLRGIRHYRTRLAYARKQKEELKLNLSAITGIDYTRDKIQVSPQNTMEEAGWRLAGQIAVLNREIEFLTMEINARLTAIRALESPYSDVLMLRYSEYLYWDEIADKMGYTVNYVMGELHGKALQKIKPV